MNPAMMGGMPGMMGGMPGMGGMAGGMGGGGGGGGGGGRQLALSRALFLRSVPQNTTAEELVNEVGIFGALESVRIDPATSAAFVNFVNPEHAAACLQDKPSVHLQGQRVELAWGKAKPMSEALQMAVQHGADPQRTSATSPPTSSRARCSASSRPSAPSRARPEPGADRLRQLLHDRGRDGGAQAGHGVPVGNVFPRAEPYDGAELPFRVRSRRPPNSAASAARAAAAAAAPAVAECRGTAECRRAAAAAASLSSAASRASSRATAATFASWQCRRRTSRSTAPSTGCTATTPSTQCGTATRSPARCRTSRVKRGTFEALSGRVSAGRRRGLEDLPYRLRALVGHGVEAKAQKRTPVGALSKAL